MSLECVNVIEREYVPNYADTPIRRIYTFLSVQYVFASLWNWIEAVRSADNDALSVEVNYM